MLATKVICPNCSRTLKTTTPLPVGKKVLCRQCGTTFGVPADNGPSTPAPVPRLVEPVPVAPVAGGMGKGLIFGGVIAGALLLLFAGSAAAIAYAALKHRTPAPVAQATPTTPAPTEGDNTGEKPPEVINPVQKHEEKVIPVAHETEKPGEKPWLPREEQEKVDKAIVRGLEYLRKQQQANGTWPGAAHVSGMAALPGLTLLECGAKADDPQVVKAADLVRGNVKAMHQTYELALCILFLDRLGDPKDQPLIQTMAVRLIAGQSPSGGWTYNCPILNDKDQRELLEVLQDTRPARAPESITDRPGGGAGAPGDITTRPGAAGATGEVTTRPGDKVGGNTPPADPKDLDGPFKGVTPIPPTGGGNLKGDKAAPQLPDAQPGNLKGDKTKPAAPRATLDKLSQTVKRVPALQPLDAVNKAGNRDAADNSNTQFAILAIWVSGRHDVPTEKVCALIDRRFRSTQGTAGNWGYQNLVNTGNPAGSPAMTAAGLLGLAVGHGVNAPAPGDKPTPKEGLEDEAIKKGFKYLSENLGKSQAAGNKARPRAPIGQGLYFLWSVERVGVMYNLRTIGDKDWYAWGSEAIVDHQNANGSWTMDGFPGSAAQVDTCFALLFLKRANLAKDLSTKIEYLIDIKGVGGRN